MKAKSSLILIAILFLFSACSTSTSPVEQNNILTDDVVSELDNILDQAMVSSNTPGAIAGVFTDDGESWIATRGASNIETDEPMNENCHFRIGSNTKTFVATVLLQLVNEGLVQLHTPISEYLPDINIPSGDSITVRMLGNMTSGLMDYSATEEFMSVSGSGEMIFTPEQLTYIGCIYPLKFTPGTEFDYCNTNYVLLGILIEKVTGKSVKQNLEERIFEPLGLTNTSWPSTRFLPQPYAHGYSRSLTNGLLNDFSFYQPSWMDAAGILVSDLYDMEKYAKVFAEGDLLTSLTLSERSNYNTIFNTSYGPVQYGFGIMNYWGWEGHTGATPGYSTAMFHNLEKGITIIVFTNYQQDPGMPAQDIFIKLSTLFN